jgi:hypothetical protein
LVDAPDSKSGGGNIVLVRVRPGAPIRSILFIADQSSRSFKRCGCFDNVAANRRRAVTASLKRVELGGLV